MQIPKPTTADIGLFRSAVPDDPRVEAGSLHGSCRSGSRARSSAAVKSRDVV